MRRYRDLTPRRIDVVKWAGKCAGCGGPIAAGESGFYYPQEKRLFGDKCGCSEKPEADWNSHLMDETGGCYGWS